MSVAALAASLAAAALLPGDLLGVGVPLVAVLVAVAVGREARLTLDVALFGSLALALAAVPAIRDAGWVVALALAGAWLAASAAVAGPRLAALVAPLLRVRDARGELPEVPSGLAPVARGGLLGGLVAMPFAFLFAIVRRRLRRACDEKRTLTRALVAPGAGCRVRRRSPRGRRPRARRAAAAPGTPDPAASPPVAVGVGNPARDPRRALRGPSSRSSCLLLYEAAFGLTRPRLLAEAFTGWLAAVFVLVVAAGVVSRVRRKVARIGAAGTALALLAFAPRDPDGTIAERNVERWRESGRLDVAYLTTLSADAAPALAELPEPLHGAVPGTPSGSAPDSPTDWAGATRRPRYPRTS